MTPVAIFVSLAVLFHLILTQTKYGSIAMPSGRTSRPAGCRGIKVANHKILVYAIAGMLAALAAIVLSPKNLTAQAGMGVMYELDAIAMAVIGGIACRAGGGRSSAPASGR